MVVVSGKTRKRTIISVWHEWIKTEAGKTQFCAKAITDRVRLRQIASKTR
jgi:hypothetical protein